MKKHLLYLAVAALPLLATSCSDDDDPVNITVHLNQTELTYNAENVWEGVSTNNQFQSQYMLFSHEGEIGPWGLVWNGFTPARVSSTEVQSNWLDHQFQIMTGGGVEGVGTPYIVAFWDNQENKSTPVQDRSCRITYQKTLTSEPAVFAPIYVYVQNTAYTYYTMRDGSAFSKKFDRDDYLILTAHGVKTDGTELETSIWLADGNEYLNEWTQFDLRGLGEITTLYFTLRGSDTGQWGLNTPSYFALDQLTVRAELF
ncbi:MAG: DUF4465 domain-containing protein [Prevotella sp.]|nr:DUF4465 domain-containing protein [Prevotella sp.]MCM1074242.1 DUF4465 domain-containing protein [Ruminococcus sp.]